MDETPANPVDPEIEAAVLRFMKANPLQTRYYWHMMKQNPERALQEIMCRRMGRMEELEQLADILKPLIKQWAAQTPGLHECIEATVKKKILFPSVAYIEEALRMKERMDMGSHSEAPANASV